MKFIEVDFTEFNNKYRRYHNNMYEMLKTINDLNAHCLEIVDHNYVDAKVAQNSIAAAIKRYGFNNLKVSIRTSSDNITRVFVLNSEARNVAQ